MQEDQLRRRARLHAVLGDPHRLAIVDQLVLSDRGPSELRAMLGIDSNLMAHHLDVLERLGVVERTRSHGDQRRRYVRLVPMTLAELGMGVTLRIERVVFVCTENIARSQLAAALWNHLDLEVPACSGGTHPRERVHPGAVKAAARRGLDLAKARPGPLPASRPSDLMITVCDRAHESLQAAGDLAHIHWSVPDPVGASDADAFEVAMDLLTRRIHRLEPLIRSA